MKNFNLAAIIIQFLCGLVCIGLGIFYCFGGTVPQIVIFFVVGVCCIINAVRMFLNNNKDGK